MDAPGASVKLDIYDERRDKKRDVQRDMQRDKQRDASRLEVYVVDEKRAKRKRESDFVYVNDAYVGSVGDLDSGYRIEPPTTVIKEQYWACSKWPTFQKTLVVTVGILMGLVVGLAVWLAISNQENPPISDIFQRSHPAPD